MDKKVCTGVVEFFSNPRGYGFIKPDDGGKDLFVHFSNILVDGFKTLRQGDRVEYELGQNAKGVQAVQVKVVNK